MEPWLRGISHSFLTFPTFLSCLSSCRFLRLSLWMFPVKRPVICSTACCCSSSSPYMAPQWENQPETQRKASPTLSFQGKQQQLQQWPFLSDSMFISGDFAWSASGFGVRTVSDLQEEAVCLTGVATVTKGGSGHRAASWDHCSNQRCLFGSKRFN